MPEELPSAPVLVPRWLGWTYLLPGVIFLLTLIAYVVLWAREEPHGLGWEMERRGQSTGLLVFGLVSWGVLALLLVLAGAAVLRRHRHASRWILVAACYLFVNTAAAAIVDDLSAGKGIVGYGLAVTGFYVLARAQLQPRHERAE